MNSIQLRLQVLKWISQGFLEGDIYGIIAGICNSAFRSEIVDITSLFGSSKFLVCWYLDS